MAGAGSGCFTSAVACALIVLGGAGLWAPPAAAQSAESQAADALFRQAKALLEKGEFEPACEKFAASQALEPGLGTLLYLGDCYERAGRFASALMTFREAEQLAKQRGDETRLRLARVRVSALEPRAPTLEVRRGPAPQPLDLHVTVGGVPLPSADFGKPIPRDAGRYEVRFSAPGYEPFVSTIKLDNADGVVVTAPRLVPVASARSAGLSDEAPAGSSSQRTLAWVIGGTGAALIATAGVFVGLAASKNRDSKADCSSADENRCGPAGVRLRNDARSLANVATVASVLGAVGLAGGAVLYLSAPDTEDPLGRAALLELRAPWF